MVIVVRIGLGLAYQGASSSSTPYHHDHRRRDYYHNHNNHDPLASSSSTPPSSSSRRNRNNGQLSTFKAASHQDSENEGLQSSSLSMTLGGSSSSTSKTKLPVDRDTVNVNVNLKGSESSRVWELEWLEIYDDLLYGLDSSGRDFGERSVSGEKEGRKDSERRFEVVSMRREV